MRKIYLLFIFAHPSQKRQVLPTGPAEIIQNGKSGFHIDPYHGDEATDIMADFFEKCAVNPQHWDAISKGAGP
jgi:hypothetical protein